MFFTPFGYWLLGMGGTQGTDTHTTCFSSFPPSTAQKLRSDPDLDTPPPIPSSPWDVQFVEVVRTTFGPNLVLKAPIFFLVYGGGQKFTSPSVCMLNSNVHAKRGPSPPSAPPPPPKKIWLLGLEPQWVNFFLKPHICLFKMMSATTGSF